MTLSVYRLDLINLPLTLFDLPRIPCRPEQSALRRSNNEKNNYAGLAKRVSCVGSVRSRSGLKQRQQK